MSKQTAGFYIVVFIIAVYIMIFTLDMSGVSYQPYGDAGLPYATGAITTGAGLSNPSDSSSGSTDLGDTSGEPEENKTV